MNCEEFNGLISFFLDGTLEERLEDFKEHAASCEKCWNRLAEAEKIHALLGALPLVLAKESVDATKLLKSEMPRVFSSDERSKLNKLIVYIANQSESEKKQFIKWLSSYPLEDLLKQIPESPKIQHYLDEIKKQFPEG